MDVMAIPTDHVLVDAETGELLAADVTVIVPDVQGAAAYDILFDADAAIEYGEGRGLVLDLPESSGIPVDALEEEERGYLAIDLNTGYLCAAENLVLIEWTDEVDLEVPEVALDRASGGAVPVVPEDIRDVEGLPFESVNEE